MTPNFALDRDLIFQAMQNMEYKYPTDGMMKIFKLGLKMTVKPSYVEEWTSNRTTLNVVNVHR